MRTAALEIGTTACRVIVGEATTAGGCRVLDDRSVVLRLERAVRRDGILGAGSVHLTAETARRLQTAAFRLGVGRVDVTVVPALTRAGDHGDLCEAVRAATGAQVRTRGEDEDRAALRTAVAEDLGRLQVGPLLRVEPHRLELIDACGEVRWSCEDGVADLLPAATDPLHPASVSRLRTVTRAAATALPTIGGEVTITGVGAHPLATALVARRFGPGGPHPRGAVASAAALEALERELLGASAAQRLLLPGVDPAQIDEVARTLLVVRELVEVAAIERVRFAPVGPLDGLLLDALVDTSAGSARVRAIAGHATDATRRMARLAGELFDGVHATLGLDDDDREVLTDAALLSAIDGGSRGGAHHRRGSYTLLTQGLAGCDPVEIAERACLVRFQTGRLPGPHLPVYGRLPAQRRRVLRHLTGLLRLARGLATEAGVASVHVDGDADLLVVHARGRGPMDLVLHATRSDLRAVRELLEVALVVRPEIEVSAARRDPPLPV